MNGIVICLLTLLFSLSSPAREGNADFWQSSLAAKTAVAGVDDLLRPGGNLLGTVVKGATPNIRTVSQQEFATLQQQLLSGAKQSGQYAGGKGTWYDLANGGRVGVRTSDSAGITLDVDIPGYPKGLKIHQ